MKRIKYFTALSTLTFLITPPFSIAAQNTGQDGSIEWRKTGSISLPSKPIVMEPSLDGKLMYILTENSKIMVYDNRGNLQGSIPVDDGITSIDISPKGEILYLMDEKNNLVSIVSVDMVINVDITGSPLKGLEEAPVTIVVYADFE